jgi:hypothetical protein
MVAAIKPVIVVGTTYVEFGMPGRYLAPGRLQLKMIQYSLHAMDLLESFCLAAISKAHVAQQVEHFLGKEEVHRFDPGRGLHLVLVCRFERLRCCRRPLET